MKTIPIYLVIKPWDYTTADVVVFLSKKCAEQEIVNGKSDEQPNVENWSIEIDTIEIP